MPDVLDLRDFYQQRLGRRCAHLIAKQVRRWWPAQQLPQPLMGIGFATPVLQRLCAQGAALALMDHQQGVMRWSNDPYQGSVLCRLDQLPLANQSIEFALVMHAVEFADDALHVLREWARVLKPNGHLVLIIPNRRGLLCRFEHTPFGNGTPYSPHQISTLIKAAGLQVERMRSTFFAPPTPFLQTPGLAGLIESMGQWLCPLMGGILMIDITKQVYAPIQEALPQHSNIARKRVHALNPV